jgi:hypothetical protein
MAISSNGRNGSGSAARTIMVRAAFMGAHGRPGTGDLGTCVAAASPEFIGP